MKKIKARTVDAYLRQLPDDKRAALQRLRKDIRAAIPEAEECISYGMPGFRYRGKVVVWLGAATHHCSFYPGGLVEEFKDDLKGYATSKGTIRFSPDKPLPSALVRKLVKAAAERRTA